MTHRLDALDQQILKALQENARSSLVALARKLSVPRTTIAQRMRHMEHDQIILGYAVRLNRARLGLPLTTFLLLQAKSNLLPDTQDLGRRIAALPGVEELHVITGEWDLLIKIRAAGIQEATAITKRIEEEPGIGRTLTFISSVVLREP